MLEEPGLEVKVGLFIESDKFTNQLVRIDKRNNQTNHKEFPELLVPLDFRILRHFDLIL